MPLSSQSAWPCHWQMALESSDSVGPSPAAKTKWFGRAVEREKKEDAAPTALFARLERSAAGANSEGGGQQRLALTVVQAGMTSVTLFRQPNTAAQ